MHRFYITAILFWSLLPLLCFADDLTENFLKGNYEEALKYIDDWGNRSAKYKLLKTVGKYKEAFEIWKKDSSKRYDLAALYEGIEILQLNGLSEDANQLKNTIQEIVREGYESYKPIHLVICGKVLLESGEEARTILKKYYEAALKEEPTLKEAYLEAAELCFSKEDNETAAKYLQRALKNLPDDPDILFNLAKAFKDSDQKYFEEIIAKVFEVNPKHLPTKKYLLFQSLLKSDSEQAQKLIESISEINSVDPELFTLKSCYELMEGNTEKAVEFQIKALSVFKDNPRVDLTIGQYLSYNGFFEESNKYLRNSLRINPELQEAKLAIALNLLRMGQTDTAFKLASDIHTKDPYNLTAFNLVQLNDVYSKLEVIETKYFTIRMHPHEAKVYGDSVTALLQKAHSQLNQKYGYTPKGKVYVDFFDDADDFAIRNFAYPLEFGALGICFGNVITMKSFSAMNEPRNWQETLWHEYAHVVTLGKSNKKVPRWFTEGISVYEEWLGPDEWGMTMTPEFRAKIIQEDIYSISKLNSAFHGRDIMFAYFQSGHLVNYLIDNYGFEKLQQSLTKMASNNKPTQVLTTVYGDLEKIDNDFKEYFIEMALNIADEVSFKPLSENIDPENPATINKFLFEDPNNLSALLLKGNISLEKGLYEDAEYAFKKVIELYPELTEGQNAYLPLARVYEKQKKLKEEYEIRKSYHDKAAHEPRSLIRLIELCKKLEKWEMANNYAEKLIAINPITHASYMTIAEIALRNKDNKKAIKYFERALLCKDIPTKVETHFTLAKLYKEKDSKKAKRYLLLCLEEAPRFRDGYRLLKELK